MDRVNRYISILYRYGQRFLTARLRPLGLDVGLLPAFLQLCRFPGSTQEEIASRTGMDKGTTARSVKRLEEQGYASREGDPWDRRVNHIYPTEKARALEPQVEQVLVELHRYLYQGFTGPEIERALETLRRMQENLEKAFLE
ncbi:MAG TPA: MarR family winged helix-turn-helix transcriptional regulator [Candidatus Anaerotruncus excrementipullorum]|uniref:MarR family winged helix-turn-helix transcriptional regulator n=1 Tax=Candidatus Anaerotruncus excrementipullorum TaxID=2838465 RepID=A0A9D2B791_9FIRM|nr:MarR family winged helix-turn-helix transcriptional regulator [Candidatus Anaerotruncus excrementipullorum]